ncbi:MAG: methylated-DNA--[protein]-cysteine S-methyltransferase [Thermoplasmata archaeon]|nr:methylated-DNA--[protein]-cysteine S-methyltransferase [Thermoplasmata archaeon]
MTMGERGKVNNVFLWYPPSMPLVAVYGTLRTRPDAKNEVMDRAGAFYMGKERVQGWDMYDHGPYPYVLPGGGTITIEVYQVEDISVLDSYEGYPRLYLKTRVPTSWGDAFIYHREDRISPDDIPLGSGDWVLETKGIPAGRMDDIRHFIHPTPLGDMGVDMLDDIVIRLTFMPGKHHRTPLDPSSPLAVQIEGYMEGGRRSFSVPFLLQGTAFQKDVWRATSLIPYGEVRTYGQIAEMIGRPGAFRAVGNALGVNPLPLLVPCHRVVSSGGLGGFSAELWRKRWLLRLEGYP